MYIGSDDGTLYALDAATGAVLWTLSDPNWPPVGTPAVAGGRVDVNFGGLYLRALDPATGPPIWSIASSQLDPVASTAPTVANGAIYASRHSGVTAHHP